MKKILLISLGVFCAGSIVWAVSIKSVDNIEVKGPNSKIVLFSDFNDLIGTIKGIFNSGKNRHRIGINIESKDTNSSLKIRKALVIKPSATKPACKPEIEGSIFAETGNGNHLWGCDGNTWLQLDTDPPCN